MPFDRKAPAGNDGGYLPTGVGYYKKTFTIKNTQLKHWLYFEGVYMNSTVKVNGKTVGGHPYGYTSFYCDITSAVKKGKNTVEVKVDNSAQKNCRWYSGSGIYRHVWLVVKPKVHIANWGTYVKQNKDLKTATLTTEVVNESGKTFCGKVIAKINGATGTDICLKPGERKTVKIEIDSKVLGSETPKLWTLSSPNLYTAIVSVYEAGKVIDSDAVKFGMRSIEYSSSKGLLLNGKTIKINGACLHHDNGILGAAAFDNAEVRKVRLMKEAGFNAVRTSHNPTSEAFLNACDSLGMLVIDEAFDGWRDAKNKHDYHELFDSWWQKDIDAMVLRDRNHPSIMAWSIGNEVIERKKIEVVTTAHKLASEIKKYDDRPVTSALAAWDKDWEIYDPLAAQLDIVGYNYMIHKHEGDHKRVPERVMWQTESYPKDAFNNWKTAHYNSYVVGDFAWTGLDYIGESGIGRWWYDGETPGEHYQRPLWPAHASYCGDVDLTGWRKPVSHYREMLWNNTPGLYMAVYEPDGYKGKINTGLWAVWPTWESWNWHGWEGKDIDVVVYTREPSVKLYLNDKLVGEKQVSEETKFKAVFRLPYQPGTLRAEAGGKAVTLKTAGRPAKVIVEREPGNDKANDVSFYQVKVVDSEGNICPDAENVLKATVKGGTIQAFGNANFNDTEPYYKSEHRAWKGRALLVVRNGKKRAQVRVEME